VHHPRSKVSHAGQLHTLNWLCVRCTPGGLIVYSISTENSLFLFVTSPELSFFHAISVYLWMRFLYLPWTAVDCRVLILGDTRYIACVVDTWWWQHTLCDRRLSVCVYLMRTNLMNYNMSSKISTWQYVFWDPVEYHKPDISHLQDVSYFAEIKKKNRKLTYYKTITNIYKSLTSDIVVWCGRHRTLQTYTCIDVTRFVSKSGQILCQVIIYAVWIHMESHRIYNCY
jgi:hypothetical protein